MRKRQIRKYIVIILLFTAIAIATTFLRTFLVNALGMSEDQASTLVGIGQVIIDGVAAAMIVFQLDQDRGVNLSQKDIEEAQFILQYNQSFIQDPNMYQVEQRLERKYQGTLNEPLINSENEQQFVNYLVYLEGLAPLVLNNILSLDHIDDLMAYRFFLAVNNRELQENQLFAEPEYYRGCFKLYEKWRSYRKQKGRPILQESTALDLWVNYEKYGESPVTIRKMESTSERVAVAKILYDTDPYIYPAAFSSPGKAKRVLTEWMDIPGTPFHHSNIRVAVIDRKIVGAVVMMDNRSTQSYDYENTRKKVPSLPKGFEDVCSRYFSSLPDHVMDEEDLCYIPCLCVKCSYRDRGIGGMLIKSAITEHAGKTLRLHVLAQNQAAIQLYEKFGFRIVGDAEPGYACGQEAPMCYCMERIAQKGDSK